MSDITEKIGKLLAKAEATDSEAERDALFSKAQSMATAFSIDLEIARQRQADKTKRETPTHRRIYLSDLGVTSKQGLHRFVRLFLRIGDANDVTCNIAHNSTYVIAFGFPSDIDVTERLFCSLAVQMVIEAEAAIKRGDHKQEQVWVPGHCTQERYNRNTGEWTGGDYVEGQYKAIDARTFKGSFYEAFTSRIGQRLQEAKREAESQEIVVTDVETGETTATTGALVLRAKIDDVKDYYKEKSTAKGSWRGGSGSSSFSSSGHSAGTKAGSSARLGAPSQIGGSRTALAG